MNETCINYNGDILVMPTPQVTNVLKSPIFVCNTRFPQSIWEIQWKVIWVWKIFVAWYCEIDNQISVVENFIADPENRVDNNKIRNLSMKKSMNAIDCGNQ